ncbi:MAG: hypothetical protein ACE5EU_06430 [Paracoccaceae bacterium]
MPTKTLTSQTDRKGIQKTFKFGGGKNTVIAVDDGASSYGYIIDGGGGDDTIFGSEFAGFAGTGTNVDARTLLGDLLIGGDGSDTVAGGDGEDTIYGGNEDGSDASKGRNPPPTNLLVGDGGFDGSGALVDALTVAADADVSASNDTIFGGNGATNTIYADYNLITLSAGLPGTTTYTGGDDTATGGSDDGTVGATNTIYGDGNTVVLQANTSFTGGGDTLTGGANSSNVIYGESFSANFSTNASFTGGNDTLNGGDGGAGFFGQNFLYGDTRGISFSSAAGADGESFTGGNDTVTGGDGVSNSLHGDVQSISNDGTFTGGNDTLTGGNNGAINAMIGDVLSGINVGNVTGGDDTLVSGTNANDTMTGDFGNISSVAAPPAGADPYVVVGGADTFVFATNNGQDTIKDFEAGKDKINLNATGVTEAALDNFDTAGDLINGNDNFVTVTGTVAGGDAILEIDLGAAAGGPGGINIVTIEGVEELATGDFIFA